MTTKEKDADYRNAKSAFDTLELEEKAVFLVDAVFSTVLKGMEEFTTAVSDAVDDIVDRRSSDVDGPRNPSRSATKKKTTAKKKASKKATGKKATAKKTSAKKKASSTSSQSETQSESDE